MADSVRIPGCKGRLEVFPAAAADFTGTAAIIADVTSFGLDESSDIRTFFVLNDCGEQTGESTITYALSVEAIWSTGDTGQAGIKTGELRKWRFYPDFGDDATMHLQGSARWNSKSLAVTPEESQAITAAATGEGVIQATNLEW